jgi:hypothetical protein
MGIKNAEFDADLESVEKVAKKFQRRKLELLYVCNFYNLMETLFYFLKRIRNRHQILRFLYPYQNNVKKKIFLGHIRTFYQL